MSRRRNRGAPRERIRFTIKQNAATDTVTLSRSDAPDHVEDRSAMSGEQKKALRANVVSLWTKERPGVKRGEFAKWERRAA